MQLSPNPPNNFFPISSYSFNSFKRQRIVHSTIRAFRGVFLTYSHASFTEVYAGTCSFFLHLLIPLSSSSASSSLEKEFNPQLYTPQRAKVVEGRGHSLVSAPNGWPERDADGQRDGQRDKEPECVSRYS